MSEPTPSPLPPLATVADLAGRAGEDIPADDTTAAAVLRMAAAVVRAYVRRDYADGVIPDAVRDVTVEVAFRVWRNPEGLIADSVDDASRRFANVSSDGFYLTAAEKMILDGFRESLRSGLWTLGTTRNDEAADTLYVPTAPEPSGYPFPWYAADDPAVP